jgi:hypothetical protein
MSQKLIEATIAAPEEAQATRERAETACEESMDARQQAGLQLRSNRKVTKLESRGLYGITT